MRPAPSQTAQTGAWAGGPQAGNQQQIETLEASLGEAANSLYEGILDLNTPRMGLAQAWKSISATRDKLLSLYGVPLEPLPGAGGVMAPGVLGAGSTFPGKGLGAFQEGAGVPGAASQVSDWKSKLTQVVAKRAGRPLTKGEIVYTVVDSVGGFVASCAAAGLLEGSYSGEEAASSKRAAEHAAARAAIQAEFISEDPEAMVAMGKGGQFGQWGKGCAAGGGTWSAVFNQGKKRPLSAATIQPGEMDSKTKLMQSMQLLLGRPVQKGDINFEVNALEPGNPTTQYTAVVTLPEYDANEAWEGEADGTKKGAEMSAAMKVLAALEGAIANAHEEHKHKKTKVNRDKRMAQMAKGFIKPAPDSGSLLTFPTRDEFVAAGYGQEDAHPYA